MKPFYYVLLIILFIPVFGRAQGTQDTAVFTLEQCIGYALENSNTIKNSQLDEKIADARVKETRGIGLPQIDASIQLTHNNKLRRFFYMYDPNGFFSTEEIPGANTGDVIGAQNFFQLKSGGDAGVTISQILFNSSYLVGLQAASAYRDLSIKASRQTKEEVIIQVTKAYYTALINQERMQLFTSNIARVDSVLRTTKALNANGFVESIDVDRIQVALNNLIAQRDQFNNLQQLSVELLKFQMNYPMERSIKVMGDLTSTAIDTNPEVYQQNFDYTQRTEYSVLEAQRKLQKLNVKNQYSTSLPSLVAFANMGYATQSADIAGLFKTETNIDDNGFVGPDKWYPYMMIGVSLNIPIFSGLQRSYRIQQAKFSMLQIENGMNSLKSGIDLEIKQATIMYNNALKALETQNANMGLAENVARVTKIKYEQGVGSNLEVVDAENSLKEAQVNYYNALFDVLIAKVDLDKAYGKLTPPDQAPVGK